MTRGGPRATRNTTVAHRRSYKLHIRCVAGVFCLLWNGGEGSGLGIEVKHPLGSAS